MAMFLAWVNSVRGGEYVTYVDSKTGIQYYGDGVPPAVPSNVRIEVRQHESVSSVGNNWTASERSTVSKIQPTIVKNETTTKQVELSPMHPDFARLMHNMNKPLPPTRGRVVSQFNALTNAHEKYKFEMLDWRIKGHNLGYQYTPTGLSQGERRYYENIGSFDRAFRRK